LATQTVPTPKQTQPASSQQPVPAALPNTPFDYQAELRCITHEIKHNLKAKFEAAIANVQQAIVNLDKKLEEKLQQHITDMRMTQVNKTMQENHTRELENITKQLGYLVDQMSQLIGKSFDPMPRNGIGQS